jgi:hypothetical protein
LEAPGRRAVSAVDGRAALALLPPPDGRDPIPHIVWVVEAPASFGRDDG